MLDQKLYLIDFKGLKTEKWRRGWESMIVSLKAVEPLLLDIFLPITCGVFVWGNNAKIHRETPP